MTIANLSNDPNPFIGEFRCTVCGHVDKRVNEFPGEICIECHERTFEFFMTPEELTNQFRNMVK